MPTIDPAIRDTLCRAIDARRDQIVAELLQLVAGDGGDGDEGAVQDVVGRLFRTRHLTIDRWEATANEIAPYLTHVGDQAARSPGSTVSMWALRSSERPPPAPARRPATFGRPA